MVPLVAPDERGCGSIHNSKEATKSGSFCMVLVCAVLVISTNHYGLDTKQVLQLLHVSNHQSREIVMREIIHSNTMEVSYMHGEAFVMLNSSGCFVSP